MNRFRKNRKAKEAAKEAKEPSQVKDTLADLEGPSTGFSLNPLKKKEAPEPKPELDFSAALPSTDDFRTSLLMPKLSARFSMLREQDDPGSKLGKASDDSVLFPKRASRLNLFGHNPSMLADIDEVSSNDGSSRPSVALGRTDSYASGGEGYGTDDDRSQNESMMSRARRAEGNNLFGGRQKIYKIPVRSPGGSPNPSGRAMGKPVYEHDMNLSAFQRLRRKEKEERAAEEAAREAQEEDAASTVSSAQRTTFSSTASGPTANARTSTAATSIDESHPSAAQPQAQEPSEARPPPGALAPRTGSVRSRRLYGQGLTQAVQNQQSSTLHRLENLGRQRAGTPDLAPPMTRNFSRSASNLRERMQRLPIADPTPFSRPTSPPSSATSPKQSKHPAPIDSAPKDRMSPTAATFGAAPPLSPPSSETDDGASLLAAAINPEDRGKATAMGLFNRPATGFDEQQFSRRQLQMHQGRSTPPMRRPSPPRRAPPPPDLAGRPRGLSKSSYRSRAESASSHYSSDAHHGANHSRVSSVEASPSRPGVSTFYAHSTASESGDEGEDRRSYEVSSVTSQATDFGNSLHQSQVTSKPPTPTGDHLETLPESRYSDIVDLKPIEELELSEEPAPSVPPKDEATAERPDSPILQATTYGLDGISSHLRSASDKSSIYPPPSPALLQESTPAKAEPQGVQEPIAEHPPSPEEHHPPQEEPLPEQDSQVDIPSPLAPRVSPDVPVSRGSEDSTESNTIHDNNSISNLSSWKDELALHHRRDGSTETQKEREEFALELAERRRRVQEKLRSVAESESRSTSPTPGTPGRQTPDSNQVKAGNAFALLKHKGSKHGPAKQDPKMYGYNSTSTSSLVPDDSGREDERPSFSFSQHSNSSSPHVGSERSFRSRLPTISRTSHDESRESSRSRGASPGGFRAPRDRSTSDASGRSKSRSRYRERDDLETVEEGAVIAHENFVVPDNFEPPAIASVPGSHRPSMEVEPIAFDRSASAASGRYRSASRSGTPNFQYERPFPLQQSNTPSMIGTTPRPSPATPAYSANATPPLNEIPSDQSPNTSMSSNGNNIPQRAPGHMMLQKRTVNKRLISEPTFVSSTSNVPTVGITTPPVPPMNPRRRRGTQTILNAFKAERSDASRVSSPAPSITDEYSVFPDDEKRPRSRRLRKTSSEGGSMNARARKESITDHSAPNVPQYPPPAIPVDGGMF